MALKSTIGAMRKQMAELELDLEKTEAGNKAAAQRARKGTLQFAKTAKLFRKESVAAFKGGKAKKKKRR